jgi:prevent-host-death family protein
MAEKIRGAGLKQVPLAEFKDDLSRFLREAAKRDIVITRHGKPAGVLIGFSSEDDWFDYRLENDERFLRRIEQARESLRSGRGIRLEDLDLGEHSKPSPPVQKSTSTGKKGPASEKGIRQPSARRRPKNKA